MMKKILALVLCVVMLAGTLASCKGGDEKEEGPVDKGAIIPIYLTTELKSFDPSVMYLDDGAVKVLGLLYEGLTRITSDGKVEKALAKSWKIIENEKEQTYKMQIQLNDTKWSDGRAVSANDLIYAWKRILEPDFSSGAAALLFDIKNARLVKAGEKSIDDLGVAAVDDQLLEIEFETKIDYDLFLENLASPVLVPLREDVVAGKPEWADKSSTMVTNGPFIIKSYEPSKKLTLERSIYYYLEEEEKLNKYVTPYRLDTDYSKDLTAQEADYVAGVTFYLGEIPLAKRADYADKATIADMPSTHLYYFNENAVDMFKKADVRKALSMAIDRTQIASLVTYAKPATGLIPYQVFDKDLKTSFREVGGELIAPTANTAEAQKLLSAAGVSGGSFTLTHKDDEVHTAIATNIAASWTALGFNVTLKSLGPNQFKEAFDTNNYDVIAFDYQMPTTDAYSALAPYAMKFSGNGMNLAAGEYDPVPHITGFYDAAYDEKIEAVFAEKNRAARATLLHDAEAAFINSMPSMPVIFNQDAYVSSKELSNIKSTLYGNRIFNKTKLKNYQDYLPSTDTAAGAVTTAGA